MHSSACHSTTHVTNVDTNNSVQAVHTDPAGTVLLGASDCAQRLRKHSARVHAISLRSVLSVRRGRSSVSRERGRKLKEAEQGEQGKQGTWLIPAGSGTRPRRSARRLGTAASRDLPPGTCRSPAVRFRPPTAAPHLPRRHLDRDGICWLQTAVLGQKSAAARPLTRTARSVCATFLYTKI